MTQMKKMYNLEHFPWTNLFEIRQYQLRPEHDYQQLIHYSIHLHEEDA